MRLRIPVSPEQGDILFDHAMNKGTLGMNPDERAWIMAGVQKLQPGCKVEKADLDIENGEWVVDVTTVTR
jgi:hypothetical protein